MARHNEASYRRIHKNDAVNVKNRVHCPRAGRQKLAFDTERKAERYLSFLNPDDFQNSDMMPVRSYYCNSCMKYHVTSQESRREQKQDMFHSLLLAEAGM